MSNIRVPLPSFNWADGAEVWNCMLEKDAAYFKLRSEWLLRNHPSLVDSYRSILFEWLSEVSQEYKFHRETFHLALDFIDRYLAAESNIKKHQLQLIGTTCLFLAAKYEEIRPPAASEFAETTAGACSADQIIDNEIVILSAINWEITPMTPNSWLNIYMHLLLPTNNGIIRYNHKRMASVIDLALLHIESLRFPSSKLAAAAIYYFTSEKAVRQCSGYTLSDLKDCIKWLMPFVDVINDKVEDLTFIASCKMQEPNPTQMHTHIASVNLLDLAIQRMHMIRMNVYKRKAWELEDEEAEEVENQKMSGNQALVVCDDKAGSDSGVEALSSSPQKPSTTVLLTPPKSTSKARRKRHRHESSTGPTNAALYE